MNGITIPVPPLRERVPEIRKLASLFPSSGAKRARRATPMLSDDAVALLQRHTWPRNLRELKNVMERALTVCMGDAIGAEQLILDPDENATLDARVSAAPAQAARPTAPSQAESETTEPRGRLLRMDADTERRLIQKALDDAGGNQGEAAAILGISRRTLTSTGSTSTE